MLHSTSYFEEGTQGLEARLVPFFEKHVPLPRQVLEAGHILQVRAQPSPEPKCGHADESLWLQQCQEAADALHKEPAAAATGNQ